MITKITTAMMSSHSIFIILKKFDFTANLINYAFVLSILALKFTFFK